jgi:Family of unknown function (DUF5759)
MRDRPSAHQLQADAKERRRRRRECYDSIVDRVFTRVVSKSRQGWVRVVYEVPPFVAGLPPYDVSDCTRHVARVLRRNGYFVETFDHVIYISWDPAEAKHGGAP